LAKRTPNNSAIASVTRVTDITSNRTCSPRHCRRSSRRGWCRRIGARCRDCCGTGFSGRIGIYEMLRINDDLRELLLARASEQTLLKVAKETSSSHLRNGPALALR